MTQIVQIQRALTAAGFYNGNIDGDFGDMSQNATLKALATLPGAKPATSPLLPLPAAAGQFSPGSAARLAQAHPLLQKLMTEARKHIVFEVMDSQRGKAAQESAFKAGNSKAHFGQSAHNWSPSIALDIRPDPLDWKDLNSFIALSRVILPLAKSMGIPIRWGGDWNGNGVLSDEKLSDLPHYELNPWRDFAKSSKPFAG